MQKHVDLACFLPMVAQEFREYVSLHSPCLLYLYSMPNRIKRRDQRDHQNLILYSL